jgi:hypothetical protein
MRLDAAGNLGLGVTPSAWGAGWRAFEFGGAGGNALMSGGSASWLTSNCYYNGTNWIYKASYNASYYLQNGGVHSWLTSASGTAGNAISFTQAMTLDASGRLGIGTSSPATLLHVYGGTSRITQDGTVLLEQFTTTANAYVGTASSHPLILRTGNTDRATIDAAGNLGLGVSPSAWGVGYKAFQLQGGVSLYNNETNSFLSLAQNIFVNSVYENRYIASAAATRYRQSAGAHIWDIAPSGNAGSAISFTQAMTLDASGRLLVATTSNPNSSVVNVAGDISITYQPVTLGGLRVGPTGAANQAAFLYDAQTGHLNISPREGYATVFRLKENGTTAMTLTSGGLLGVGATSPTSQLEALGVGGYWTGSGWSTTPAAITITNSQAGGYDPVIIGRMTDSGGTSKNAWAIGAVGTSAWTAGNNSSQTADMYFAVRNNSGGISEAMRLSSGNLGVGSTTPAGAKLFINGGSLFTGTPGSFGIGISGSLTSGRIGTYDATSAAVLNTYYDNSSIELSAGITSGYACGISITARSATNYANTVRFVTTGTEAARFDGSGNLLVGTTSSSAKTRIADSANQPTLLVENTNASFNSEVITVRPSRNTTGGSYYAYSYYNNGAAAYRFYVIDGGNIYSTSATVNVISDIRLKENVRDLDTGLEHILKLRPRRFDWKEGQGDGSKNTPGFIAQEVEQVIPELVVPWKVTEKDDDDHKGLATGNLIPTLVKAIQELAAKVTALEAKQ